MTESPAPARALAVDAARGVRSETGRLRSVMLHRPGPELSRLTPRNNDALLFDGIPWVERAQQEHDAFAQVLRDHGVEVLLLADLLRETLAVPQARADAVANTVADLRLGDTLRAHLTTELEALDADDLATALMAGLRNDEIGTGVNSLVTAMKAPDDFVIDPLPNLLFTRDSSVWIGDRPVITSLAMPARRRESQLTELIYTHHPRFTGARPIHVPAYEYVEGGDVLQLDEGVIAVGVGERTTPAGVERLASTLFAEGLVHTVLAVPIHQQRATMHLDTICTMVDVDAVVMYPNVADELQAYTVTDSASGPRVSRPMPFLDAAGRAMGIERLRNIDTGLDPVTAEREQWDDGNNTLAVAPTVCVAYERNVQTNRRLTEAGITVLEISGAELGSGRGGPRCMSCPIERDPLP